MSILENPNNLSVKQALLDLFIFLNTEDKETLKDLMERNSVAIMEASKKFDAHQYPSNRLTFGKLTNMQQFPIFEINKESTDAINVFICLCSALNSTNNCIQVKNAVLKGMTGLSLAGLRKALKILIKYGFIGVYSDYTNRDPAIYIINPELYKIGKYICDFEAYASKEALENFEKMKKANSLYINEKVSKTERSEARTVVREADFKEWLIYEVKNK